MRPFAAQGDLGSPLVIGQDEIAVVRFAGGIADHTFATDALFAGCRGRDAGLSQSLGNRHAKRHGDARTATGQYHLETIRSRSEAHTSELQYLMRNSYAVLRLKKKKHNKQNT